MCVYADKGINCQARLGRQAATDKQHYNEVASTGCLVYPFKKANNLIYPAIPQVDQI